MDGFVGIDEVGRGALAGPVFAAAVILKPGASLAGAGAKDSKQLSARRREALSKHIHVQCGVAIGQASVQEIEKFNILGATFLAMQRALALLALEAPPVCVLVDGSLAPDFGCPVQAIVGGDATVPLIAAASIVAKVARDQLMRELHSLHPAYDFSSNKGYGTKTHLQALRELGPSPIHRLSFAPCQRAYNIAL